MKRIVDPPGAATPQGQAKFRRGRPSRGDVNRGEIVMKITKWKLTLVTVILVASAPSRAACQQNVTSGNVAEDPPFSHNMLVVGTHSAFVSHLPMFDALNEQKTDYTSPHRYQVIMEVRFMREGKDVTDTYTKDRESNVATKMYTLEPRQRFVLAKLFTPNHQNPALRSFRATIFRDHLERNGQKINGLEDVVVDIKGIVHAHKFEPSQEKPEKLEYFLFGKGDELFLAHLITNPPDFDQILSVKVTGHRFTDEELSRGVSVLFRTGAIKQSRELKKMSKHGHSFK